MTNLMKRIYFKILSRKIVMWRQN